MKQVKQVRCSRCGWTDEPKRAIHSYQSFRDWGGEIEVEPMDFCPSCGSFQLEDLEVINDLSQEVFAENASCNPKVC